MNATLVTDEPISRKILSEVLSLAGLTVMVVPDSAALLARWADEPGDLLLFAYPRDDVLTLIQRMRAVAAAPVIMILEQLEESHHVALLDGGADLVLDRAYSPRLLVSQCRSLASRGNAIPLPALSVESQAGLQLDPVSRVVRVEGRGAQRLTHLEFRLLYTLIHNRNQVLAVDTLVERVWGYGAEGSRELVRGLVSRLRAKVEPDRRTPRLIVTVPGEGYAFVPTR